MTEPIDNILPRIIDNQKVTELLNKLSDTLNETVNFGTHILNWDNLETHGGDENIPVIMMVRHILELTDSIAILLKHASTEPCKLQLRGILETFLGLEYILETNSKERALSFLVWNDHKKLKFLKKLTPCEQSYEEFSKRLKVNKDLPKEFHFSEIKDLKEEVAFIEKNLALPLYAISESEYQKKSKKSKEWSKPGNWFSLFDGPKDVLNLAIHLNRDVLYEILYRNWSGAIHGTDIIDYKCSSDGSKKLQVNQLRFPKDMQIVTFWAIHLSLMTYSLMIEKRIGKHKPEYDKWLLSINDVYLQLKTKNLVTVTN